MDMLDRIGFLCCLWVVMMMPSHAGPSMEKIQAAHQYSVKNGGIGLIVQERGVTRFERYYNGHSKEEPVHIYSGTKSFIAVAAAIAVDRGLFTWDEKVADTITEWQGDKRKEELTVRHLLDFTSGLHHGFEEIYSRDGKNKLKVALTLEAKRKPDSSFIYGPGHLQVFGEFFNRKMARAGSNMHYQDFLQAELLGPLGIQYTQWREDDYGNPHLSAGMHMSAGNWLRFGQLLLQNGVWQGQVLVSQENLQECFTGTKSNPAFGLCFWLNEYADKLLPRVVDVEKQLAIEPLPEDWKRCCLSKDAPTDLVVSLGSNGQRLYILPSQQLLILHQGKRGKFEDAEFLKLLFEEKKESSGLLSIPSSILPQ